MDQFNKALAILLVVIVAIGISTFVFYRLGLLKNILPSGTKIVSNITNKTSQQISPTPTTIVTISSTPAPSVTPQQQESTSLLGFLFRKNPSPTITPAIAKTVNSQPSPIQTTNVKQPNTPTQLPMVTVVPYGSTNPVAYPATGAQTLLLPAFLSWSAIGIFLKNKSKK